MHWFKRNIGDYHKKAGRLTMLQHGAYTLLMDSCYDREHFPTKEEAIDWVWASTTEEIQAVEFVLSRFFKLEDGIYIQPRIAEELSDYKSKAENNKRIAIEREAKRRENRTKEHESCTGGKHSVNETPPNQEPLTTNQEPLINNKDLVHQDERTSDEIDVDKVLPVWNSLNLKQHRTISTKARNNIKKLYAVYKKGKKEPLSITDWLCSYLSNGVPKILNEYRTGKGIQYSTLEYFTRLDQYEEVKDAA